MALAFQRKIYSHARLGSSIPAINLRNFICFQGSESYRLNEELMF
jgi:hypothetical protein